MRCDIPAKIIKQQGMVADQPNSNILNNFKQIMSKFHSGRSKISKEFPHISASFKDAMLIILYEDTIESLPSSTFYVI